MLGFLLEISEYKAWCCGFANRTDRGEVLQQTWNFELDHIVAKSRVGEGMAHDITNLAPLCSRHNRRKGNQRLSLAELREQIVADVEFVVESTGKLIDLDWARHQALDYLMRHRMRHPVNMALLI